MIFPTVYAATPRPAMPRNPAEPRAPASPVPAMVSPTVAAGIRTPRAGRQRREQCHRRSPASRSSRRSLREPAPGGCQRFRQAPDRTVLLLPPASIAPSSGGGIIPVRLESPRVAPCSVVSRSPPIPGRTGATCRNVVPMFPRTSPNCCRSFVPWLTSPATCLLALPGERSGHLRGEPVYHVQGVRAQPQQRPGTRGAERPAVAPPSSHTWGAAAVWAAPRR